MKLHKFIARDAKSALEKIRNSLGPDALVVATRKMKDGIEMMAAAQVEVGWDETAMQGEDQQPERASHAVWQELSRLRSLLQQQLAGMAWSLEKRRHPLRVQLMQRMLAAGFGSHLSRHIASAMPKGYDVHQAELWLRQVLIRNLRILDAAVLPENQAGVWALIGPTGQGKTTTLAKLAARAVMSHGAGKVALVSLDSYRLGAREQLEAYARIMRVEVVAADDETDLPQILGGLRQKSCVLIDCAGFSPQDARFSQQVSLLQQHGIHILLTLSSSIQGSLVERLMQLSSPHAVIMTKLDEGGLNGALLDCIIRHRVPLAYLATGQRVPEDLHTAGAPYLIDRALKAQEHEAFTLREDDWAVRTGTIAEDSGAIQRKA